MNVVGPLLLLLTGGLAVEATTLDGDNLSAELQSLTPVNVVLQIGDETRSLEAATLHLLSFANPPTADRSPVEVTLQDNTRIGAASFQLDGRVTSLSSPLLADVTLSRDSMRSVRLSASDRKVQAAWEELQQRNTRDDLVVVRKGDALDHVGGVVSGIDDEAVRLLLDGTPVPIPRARVFGVVFAGGNTPPASAVAAVSLTDGSLLQVATISLEDAGFRVELTAGPALVLSPGDVRLVDFSLGKILYLSEAEPIQVEYPVDHKYFLQDVWQYRRGKNSHGEPLQVNGQAYDRGLWIHSGTTLTFRLGRQYRRLRAVAGIDEGIGDACQPTVGVVLRGDGRELFQSSLARGDTAAEVDIDVSGVRELQIEVLSHDPDGICEHLGLGDLRVIK